MIYLDAAATTLQKPPAVWRAVAQAGVCCGNPGRSGHKAALKAANIVYDCRCLAAGFFGMEDPARVVFTGNATHALNIAIRSCLQGGGHAVISGLEHNSVVRPLEHLEGVTYTVARAPLYDEPAFLKALEQAIRPDTRCVILTHVSNVFGAVLPVEKADALCCKRGLPLVIDASQSAGSLPLDVSRLQATAFVCMPGHKGLYGPQGTGILLCCKDIQLYSVMQGGTGSESRNLRQPGFLPDALESGTLNVPGIAGLAEGLRFVKAHRAEIHQRECALAKEAAGLLSNIPGLQVWAEPRGSAVLSFRRTGEDPGDLCTRLADQGLCLRAGLHCAPIAHETAGTLPQGTLRAGISAYTTRREIHRLALAVEKSRKSEEMAKNNPVRY